MLHLTTLLMAATFAADHPCDPAFPDACVDPSTTVSASAMVGIGARIGPDMAISDAIIAPRAVLDGRSAGPVGQPVGNDTIIGRRTTIGADADIGNNVVIGRTVQIGTNLIARSGVSIGYASDLGDRVTLNENAVLGTLTNIGSDSTISGVMARNSSTGTGATVNGIVGPEVQIGDNATVDGRVRRQSRILADAVVSAGARIGRGATIGVGAVIEDGATVRANAQIPGCSRLIDGDVARRDETWTGDTESGCIDIGAYPIEMTTTETNGQIFITDMDIDPATGDVYVIGNQNSNAIIAGVAVPGSLQDIFIAAFNAEGGLLWLKSLTTPGTKRAGGLDYHDGSVFISGDFSSSLEIDSATLTNVGAEPDLFVARLNATDGSQVWSRSLQTTQNGRTVDVVAGDDGVYVTGWFRETLTLPGAGATAVTSYTSDRADAFVARLDATGTWMWARRIGGSETAQADSLTPLPGGGVAVAVSFRGTLEPGTNALTSGQTATHADDAVLCIVDATGTATHCRHLSGIGNNKVEAMDAGSGRLVALAEFRGPFDFGAVTLQSAATRLAVLHMDLTATPVTGYALDADAVAYGQDIALRGDTAVVALDLTEAGTHSFGSYDVTNAGGSVAALDLSNGTWQWANAVTGDALGHPRALATQPVGETAGYVVGGRFRNTVQVGSNTFSDPGFANVWIVELAADGTW